MNKIIPFNKDIKFNENIGEITSIALDDNLSFTDSHTINGELIVRGCHKIDDLEEDFSYTLPTAITVDDKYDTKNAKITVDDFYYEIINDNILKVKIDLILDDLYYNETEIEPINREVILEKEDLDELPSTLEEKIDTTDENTSKDSNEEIAHTNNITNLFNETTDNKEYFIYRVYLVAPNDTLEKILEKYKITSEELSHYNDLSNLKPGMKLIIPSIDE